MILQTSESVFKIANCICKNFVHNFIVNHFNKRVVPNKVVTLHSKETKYLYTTPIKEPAREDASFNSVFAMSVQISALNVYNLNHNVIIQTSDVAIS